MSKLDEFVGPWLNQFVSKLQNKYMSQYNGYQLKYYKKVARCYQRYMQPSLSEGMNPVSTGMLKYYQCLSQTRSIMQERQRDVQSKYLQLREELYHCVAPRAQKYQDIDTMKQKSYEDCFKPFELQVSQMYDQFYANANKMPKAASQKATLSNSTPENPTSDSTSSNLNQQQNS